MSNEGQEWAEYNEKAIGQGPFSAQYGIQVSRLNVMMVNGYGETARKLRDRILADHRDAHQLRERVRVLEEALRDILGYLSGPNGLDVPADYKQGGEAIWRFADRALSSPVATEGEGV